VAVARSAIVLACAGIVLAGGLALARPMKVITEPNSCTGSWQCPSGMFCQTPVGACWRRGVCAGSRQFCIAGAPKICGCDHRTYRNDCAAKASRVNVLHTGACQ
jgi:hypothetical protein